MKKTDWFVWPTMPVHVGFYERKYNGGVILRDYWNGKNWNVPEWCFDAPCMNQCLPWRGLVEKTNG